MTSLTLLTLKDSEIWLDRADGDFQIGTIENDNPQAIAKGIYEMLRDKGWLGDKLVFGIDSPKVYLVKGEFDKNIVGDHEALCYQLEAQLPLEAETMAAICIGNDEKEGSYLVWDTAGVAEISQTLSSEYELALTAFVPTGLCIADQQRNGKLPRHTKVLHNGMRTERFSWHRNRLVLWDYFKGDPEMLLQDVQQDDVIDSNQRKDLLKDLLSGGHRGIEGAGYDFSEVVPFGGRKVGSVWTPILLGSLVFLVCVFAAFLFKIAEAEQAIGQAEGGIVVNYRKLFPDQRINGPVIKLLEKELKGKQKLASLMGHPETSRDLLESLGKLLEGFNQEIRFQINTMSIEPDAISISGDVKNFSDFQTLKETFGKRGFSVGTDSIYGAPFTLSLKPKTSSDSKGQL